MALLTTLTLGLPFFVWGLFQNGGRAARGLGGVAAWVLLWLLAALVVGIVHRHRQDAARGRTWSLVPVLGLAVALWVVVTVPAILSTGAGDFGMDPNPAVLFLALAVAPFGLLLARVGPALFRRLGTPPGGGVRLPSLPALLSGLWPLLLPAVALAALRRLPVAEPLAGRISGLGLSGVLLLQLETVTWPALLVAAWGLDHGDGTRFGRLHRVVLLVSLLVLGLTVAVPVMLEPEASLMVRVRLPDGGHESRRLELDALIRATSLMVAACALLAADVWRRLPVGGRGLGLVESVLLLLVSIAVPIAFVPRLGPQAAPLGVALACALAWALHRLRGWAPRPGT